MLKPKRNNHAAIREQAQAQVKSVAPRLAWVWTCLCGGTSAAYISIHKDAPALELTPHVTCGKCHRKMHINWDLSNMPDWIVPPPEPGANVQFPQVEIRAKASSGYDKDTIYQRLKVIAPRIEAGDGVALEEREFLMKALTDLEAKEKVE